MPTNDYIRWFSDIRLGDVALVGGKNASLGQLYSTLSKEGVLVPNGFALTADAYRDALAAADAWERLHRLLDKLDKRRVDLLAKQGTVDPDEFYVHKPTFSAGHRAVNMTPLAARSARTIFIMHDVLAEPVDPGDEHHIAETQFSIQRLEPLARRQAAAHGLCPRWRHDQPDRAEGAAATLLP